jgi:exopolysaccharide biosynthesis polyprenyl glycosylphosphotransferase
VVTLVASLAIARSARDGLAVLVPGLKPAVPVGDYVHLLLVFVPTWALFAQRVDLQAVARLTGTLTELLRALVWTQGAGTLVLAVLLVAAQVGLNRSLIALFLLVSTLLLMALKLAQRRWLLRHRGEALAVAVGHAPAAVREFEWFRRRRVEALEATGPEDLRRRFEAGAVDEVLLGPAVPAARRAELVVACQDAGIPVLVATETVAAALAPPGAEVVGNTLYLAYRRREPDPASLVVKGILDRAVALVAVLVAAPFLLLVGLLVRLTSAGPVFFVQERGGLNGRPFRMFKFRTMRLGAEAERDALLAANEMDGPVFKIAGDPRVTAVGRLLRRTSVDELPQLFNVLLGQMSLVGPRPLPLAETRGITGADRRRLSMKPGLTCLWQVSGRNELGFGEWMALDLKYVDNWSLGLDVAILLRTLPALLSGRGAR